MQLSTVHQEQTAAQPRLPVARHRPTRRRRGRSCRPPPAKGRAVLAGAGRRLRLPDTMEALLRATVVTPKALASRLKIAPQTATALLRELQGGGVAREVAGRGRFLGIRGVKGAAFSEEISSCWRLPPVRHFDDRIANRGSPSRLHAVAPSACSDRRRRFRPAAPDRRIPPSAHEHWAPE